MYAFALAAKTMSNRMVGKKCVQGVELLTRNGVCPVCKKRVERSYTDIFFPYCGYTCKRVVQRKEEETTKSRILAQQTYLQQKIERQLKRESEEQNKREQKGKIEIIRIQIEQHKEDPIEKLRTRISQCQAEYEKNTKEACKLPKRCEKYWNAKNRAKRWYRNMVKAQKELDELTNKDENHD